MDIKGLLTLYDEVCEGEVGESSEHDIGLFETGEDAPEAFELAEEPFGLIAPLAEFLVIVPRLLAIVLGRHGAQEARLSAHGAGMPLDARAVGPKAFYEAAAKKRIANQSVPTMLDGAVNLSFALKGPN